VSSFCGIGKKSAFSVLKKTANELETMQTFGDSPMLSLEDDSIITCIPI